MSATPAEAYKKYRWFWFYLQTGMGLFMLSATYMMRAKMAEEDEIVKNSPLVCMQVTARERSAGISKLPDIIRASYQGRNYAFEFGRKYFRSTFGVDSIQVQFDALKDRAVLPVLNFPHYTFLVVMIAGAAVMTIADAAVTARKSLKSVANYKFAPSTL